MTTTTDHNAVEQKYRQAIFVNGVFSRWHYWGFIEEHGNLTFVAPEMNISSIEEAYRNSYQCVGVEDKDGKEIYIGDILYWNPIVCISEKHGEIRDDIYANVVWLPEGGGFTLQRFGANPLRTLDMATAQILGNKYENLELVMGAKNKK